MSKKKEKTTTLRMRTSMMEKVKDRAIKEDRSIRSVIEQALSSYFES